MPVVLCTLNPRSSIHGASGVAFKWTANPSSVPTVNVPPTPKVRPGPVSLAVIPIWTASRSMVNHVTGCGRRQLCPAVRTAENVTDTPSAPALKVPATVSVRQTSVEGRVTPAGQFPDPTTSVLGARSTRSPDAETLNLAAASEIVSARVRRLTGPEEMRTVGSAILRLTVLAVWKRGMCPSIVIGPVRQVVGVGVVVGSTSLQTIRFTDVGSPTAA